VNNKYVIWISIIVWVLAVIASFAAQGSETLNAVVLVVSFWLMFLGWRLNMQRGRL